MFKGKHPWISSGISIPLIDMPERSLDCGLNTAYCFLNAFRNDGFNRNKRAVIETKFKVHTFSEQNKIVRRVNRSCHG